MNVSRGNITKWHRNVLNFMCLLALVLTFGCGSRPAHPAPPAAPPAAPAPPVSQSGEGIVEKLTLDELALRADSILVGEVTDITVYEEGSGNIYTIVTLSVEQSIKGETEVEAQMRVPGGEVDGRVLFVEDAPSFQLGERTVVFLSRGGDGLTVVGGFQGKFTVDKNNMVDGNISLTEFVDQVEDILEKQ